MATLLTTPATMEADSGLGEPTPSLWEGPAVKAESEEDESEGEISSSLATSSAPRPQSARGKLAWGAAAAGDGMDSTEAQAMKPRSVFSTSSPSQWLLCRSPCHARSELRPEKREPLARIAQLPKRTCRFSLGHSITLLQLLRLEHRRSISALSALYQLATLL